MYGFLRRKWGWSLTDSIDLTLLRASVLGTNNKTDKFQLENKEVTIRRLRGEALCSQKKEDLTQVKQMVLHRSRMNDQVIQIYGYKRATAVKSHVHCSLERRTG